MKIIHPSEAIAKELKSRRPTQEQDYFFTPFVVDYFDAAGGSTAPSEEEVAAAAFALCSEIVDQAEKPSPWGVQSLVLGLSRRF